MRWLKYPRRAIVAFKPKLVGHVCSACIALRNAMKRSPARNEPHPIRMGVRRSLVIQSSHRLSEANQTAIGLDVEGQVLRCPVPGPEGSRSGRNCPSRSIGACRGAVWRDISRGKAEQHRRLPCRRSGHGTCGFGMPIATGGLKESNYGFRPGSAQRMRARKNLLHFNKMYDVHFPSSNAAGQLGFIGFGAIWCLAGHCGRKRNRPPFGFSFLLQF